MYGSAMSAYARFLITLPITLPLLGLATYLDFCLAPISNKLETDLPKKVAEVAFEVMGV